jgi:hypothetical protein
MPHSTSPSGSLDPRWPQPSTHQRPSSRSGPGPYPLHQPSPLPSSNSHSFLPSLDDGLDFGFHSTPSGPLHAIPSHLNQPASVPSASSLQALADLEEFQLHQRQRHQPPSHSAFTSPNPVSLLTRQLQQRPNASLSTSPIDPPSSSAVQTYQSSLPSGSFESARRVASGRKPAEGGPSQVSQVRFT